jgi:predicted transposase/invertase (TIGR01784 family)
MAKKLVRFDWAMKKMLRHKANFDILEGFLSELLGEEIKIKQILDSESNKETEDDKYNRVDILVEFSSGELVIIEIQDSKEYDYFHRILFGTSKVITEHIKEGEPFASVKKVISITIAYFDLGQGKDYVYHGTTTFQGIHQKDILTLSEKQVELYKKSAVYEIYPEYWLIKVGKFSNTVNDKLDEWIYFFKNAEIKNNFSAKGLKAAGERLVEMKLNEKDQKEYKKYLKHLHEVASGNYNEMVDAQDLINQGIEKGIEKGAEQKEVEAVVGLNRIGLEKQKIAEALGITVERVNQIIENQENK